MGWDQSIDKMVDGERTEVVYWRNARHINTWFDNLAHEKGAESVFRTDLPLTLDDIERFVREGKEAVEAYYIKGEEGPLEKFCGDVESDYWTYGDIHYNLELGVMELMKVIEQSNSDDEFRYQISW